MLTRAMLNIFESIIGNEWVAGPGENNLNIVCVLLLKEKYTNSNLEKWNPDSKLYEYKIRGSISFCCRKNCYMYISYW